MSANLRIQFDSFEELRLDVQKGVRPREFGVPALGCLWHAMVVIVLIETREGGRRVRDEIHDRPTRGPSTTTRKKSTMPNHFAPVKKTFHALIGPWTSTAECGDDQDEGRGVGKGSLLTWQVAEALVDRMEPTSHRLLPCDAIDCCRPSKLSRVDGLACR